MKLSRFPFYPWRPRFRPFFWSLFLLTFFFRFDSAANQVSNIPAFKQCWQFATADSTAFAPTVYAENALIALAGGELVNLDAASGSVLWKANLGGEIVSSPFANQNTVFVLTQDGSLDGISPENKTTTIRALSLETGITIWKADFADTAETVSALDSSFLVLGTNSRKNGTSLVALDAKSGDPVWKKNFPAAFSSPLAINNFAVYLAAAGKSLYSLKLSDGNLLKEFKLSRGVHHKIAAAKGNVYFGDENGNVTALRAADLRVLWALKTGGAIQDIIPIEDGIMISSLDNFVYFHKLSNGDRRWRKRLNGRPLGATKLNENTVLLLTNGENAAFILDLKKGKISGQIPLGDGNYPIAPAAFAEQTLVLPTFKGVFGFSQNPAGCKTATNQEKEKGAK